MVKTPVRTHRRVDQQHFQAVALREMGRIVATQRTADQQWLTGPGNDGFELGNGLSGVMMQCRQLQLVGNPHALHGAEQLLRLG